MSYTFDTIKDTEPLPSDSESRKPVPIFVGLISEQEFDQMVCNNPDAHNLQYLMDRSLAREQGIITENGIGLVDMFLISPIDSRAKYSRDHSVCVGHLQ